MTQKSGFETVRSAAVSSPEAAVIGEVTGYQHTEYALALSEFGIPLELPRSRGKLLRRPIPDSPLSDAIGCYPIFSCLDWSGLQEDLADLQHDLVSVALVADPFGGHTEQLLQFCFPDVMKPFKQHFVIDLTKPVREYVSEHHRRNAKKAAAVLDVERCERPIDFLTDWNRLYSNLIDRHGISGIAEFSKQSFARQFVVPGIETFRAIWNGSTVGMLLWYVQGPVSYYHLGAYSPKGYELKASFALFEKSIEFFTDMGLQWLNLGAGAGVTANNEDGLTRFKRGWASGTRTAYFCGKVVNGRAYSRLTSACQANSDTYFPAYRARP